jgi:mRNA-degrading endonuclease RelE of RelBE toxin-antitoxin system
MATKISYSETAEFRRDLKQLLKKFHSLEIDIELAKEAAIELFHIGFPDSRGVLEKRDIGATFLIPDLCTEKIQICKIKKFSCQALRGRGKQSGIRIIYAFHTDSSTAVFIEIYFKGEKESEDRKRIKEYLANIAS